MGLDIHIGTDNYNEVYTIVFYKNENDLRLKMSLSREFCHFMCRKGVSEREPEQTGLLKGMFPYALFCKYVIPLSAGSSSLPGTESLPVINNCCRTEQHTSGFLPFPAQASSFQSVSAAAGRLRRPLCPEKD